MLALMKTLPCSAIMTTTAPVQKNHDDDGVFTMDDEPPHVTIIVDTREKALYNALLSLPLTTASVESACLDIGDVVIRSSTTTQMMVLERKTIQDVASSIQDGRWSEQKRRALAQPHKLMYLIEVEDMSRLFEPYPMHGRIQSQTVMNAVLNLGIHYHIPYVFLEGVDQIAQYLYRLAIQFHRLASSSRDDHHEDESTPEEKYVVSFMRSHNISSQKRKNMNAQIFFRMVLQLIPGISEKTATNIHHLFQGGFLTMVDFVRDHDKSTFHALYQNEYGRSLHRRVVDTLYEFVLDTSPPPPPKSNATVRKRLLL